MRQILLSLLVLILLVTMIVVMRFTLSTSSDTQVHIPNLIPLPNKQTYIPRALNIDEIFAEDHSWTSTLSANKKITLIATGDVIPARVVNVKATSYNDFLWPFRKTADFTKNADLTVINLESPILTDCPLTSVGFTFCGNAKFVDGLVLAGVDLASFANNHQGNYGLSGTTETRQHLEDNGITPFGSGEVVYKKVKGVTFAFLGYNDIGAAQDGINHADENLIADQITETRKNADIVIVEYHWGIEYQPLPSQRQVELAHFTIDKGANFVIGNHPHWIQPVEIYQGKLITYAHGNFVFDQEWSEKTKLGVVGKYVFYGKDLVDVQYFPVKIEGFGQPDFLSGADKENILSDMLQNSLALETR